MHSYSAVITSPFGKLGILTDSQVLVGIDFLPATFAELQASNNIAAEACRQLQAYFANSKHEFCLPLQEKGSPFQSQVWQSLRQTTPGQTLSYGELAKRLNTSARAIGNACRHNPIPIVTPCHRIVAKTKLGGFSGHLTGSIWNIKHWLLQHEGAL